MFNDTDCELVKDTLVKCQRFVMDDSTVEAVEYLKMTLHEIIDLVKNADADVDLSKFTITETYNGNYSNPRTIPHAKAAEDMMDKGETVNPGDKISYIFKAPRFTSGKIVQGKLKSDSAVAVHHFRKLDRHCIDGIQYIELLKQPIVQFMQFVYPDIEKLFKDAKSTIEDLHFRQTTILHSFGRQLANLKQNKVRHQFSFSHVSSCALTPVVNLMLL